MANQEFNTDGVKNLILAQAQGQMIRAVIDEDRKTSEEDLRKDQVWAASARMLYEANNGKPFEGDDEDAAQYGLDEMSSFNMTFFNADMPWSDEDSKGMVEYLNSFENWSDAQKLSFGYLMEMYENKGVSWAGVGRGLRSMLQDPTNVASFGGPLAIMGKWSGRQAAKQGTRLFIREHLQSILSKRGLMMVGVASADGATVMQQDDRIRQDLENQVAGTPMYSGEYEEGFDLNRNLISAGTGVVFANTLLGSAKAAQLGYRAAKGAVDDVGVGFDLSKTDAVREGKAAQPTKFDPKDIHSRMPTKAAVTTRNRKGFNYSGAPNQKGSAQALQGVIRRLLPRVDDDLAMKERSLTWYEDAGQSIDQITRGDPNLKERMVRLLAIYSANNDVTGNTAAAIEAAMQMARGEIPYTGLTPNVTAAEIENLLTIPEFDKRHKLIGNKIMNFYRNLHDPAFGRNDFDDAVTIDRHMLTQMGYSTSNPTDNQYAYAQHLIKEITRKYNEANGTEYLPRQIQAALWTHERNLKETAAGRGVGFSGFKEEIDRATAQVPWEIMSAVHSKFPEFPDLMPEEQIQFTREARELLLDDAGNDIILSKILQHPLYKHLESESGWDAIVGPSTQSAIVLPRMEGKAGGPYDPSVAELYASLMGHIYGLDSVPWFRFDSRFNASDVGALADAHDVQQGVGIRVSGHDATEELTDALTRHIEEVRPDAYFTRIELPDGTVSYTFINFMRNEMEIIPGVKYEDVTFGHPDEEFASIMDQAIVAFFKDRPEKATHFDLLSEGRLIQNGEYQTEITSKGSSDLLDWGNSRRSAFDALIQSWQTKGSEVQ